uniref:Calpain catalytic domain-containing protein n=1 Tax=Strigamia maritima TaxID=126957 RepID=T1JH95_STRMM
MAISSTEYAFLFLLEYLFGTITGKNAVYAYYCEWDQCETDQYCCGDNLCCDYVYSLWYFWVGIVFVVILLSACGGLFRYCYYNYRTGGHQSNYTLVPNLQAAYENKLHTRVNDAEAQVNYPYYEQRMNSSAKEAEAVELASYAVNFDVTGNLEPAVYFYQEAANALTQAQNLGSKLPNLESKIQEYTDRCQFLKDAVFRKNQPVAVSLSEEQKMLSRARFLFLQALDEDEQDNVNEAIELYTECVEVCLQIRGSTTDTGLQTKVSKLAEQALERAEALKGLKTPVTSPTSSTQPISSPRTSHPRIIPPLGIGNINLGTQQSIAQKPISSGSSSHFNLKVIGNDSYTSEEIDVLRCTSFINGREYVPFLLVDLKERFAYPMPFSDRDGKLVLSPKQKNIFSKWVRPEEICPNPKMIEVIDCFSIKQTVVSDCSFIASLAISAQYEKRFKKKLVTRIIYPQNRNGEPILNPCGKYMVKFHINGVLRKVVIDDYLPIGSHDELLCSYSNNRNEFWISLLEKAYLKVMGGYDFPGSNSNIDLHALTGWIPERIAIHPNDRDLDKERVFQMILKKFHQGHVLITIATGELTDGDAERAGLVSTHAYALLDVREIRNHRLFMLKNPWSHLRWKGNFSEYDFVHWTPDLKRDLSFDPKSAQMFDNGVFWIDYESIIRFFDVIYMNWNPSIFQYTYCIHQTWKAGLGPVKDIYNIGENPQYSLEVNVQSQATLWILLTRHITDREDFAKNREYITVLVYKNNGKRVYYPHDPPPYIDGTRINSPHYLCKIPLTEGGTYKYTLVISQYEKMKTIHYTLRAYSTCNFSLSRIANTFRTQEEITGEWKGNSAGGCKNHPATYNNNPLYQLQINSASDNTELLIELKAPKEYQVGFDIVTVTVNNANSSGYFSTKSSGAYRSGFVILALENVPAGTYNIIPSTFEPRREPDVHLISGSDDRQDVELDDVRLHPNIERILDDDRWIDDATGLIPHCLAILKMCHQLTERLVAMTMSSVPQTHHRLWEMIEVAKKISPRVDDVVRSMYPPLDARLLEARSTALILSVTHLTLVTRSVCNIITCDWIEDSLAEMSTHLKVLRDASENSDDCSKSDVIIHNNGSII